MLVLTRKRSETIRIGPDICIKVIRTGKSTVKIGIEAPASVRVVRGELLPKPALAEQPAPPSCPFELDHGAVVMACSDQFPYPHIA